MTKINKRIEIVGTTVPGHSSMSAPSREAVRATLARHYTDVRVILVTSLADLESLAARKPDLVFLGTESLPADPGPGLSGPRKLWIARYLDIHGVPYTGSGHRAHRLQRSKQLAKQRILDAGLMTSPYSLIGRGHAQTVTHVTLAFPMFVKPNDRGGGSGINSQSLVANATELLHKVQSIANSLHADSLIEEYLPGREFSVAVLRSRSSGALVAMPVELVAAADQRGTRILSGTVKSSNTERVLAVTDKATRAAVCALAVGAFKALGARDYGRIDIRLDAAGVPHFLEANLLPSLIPGYGSFPKACALNLGLDYEAMLLAIVRLALDRATAEPQADGRPQLLWAVDA